MNTMPLEEKQIQRRSVCGTGYAGWNDIYGAPVPLPFWGSSALNSGG